MQAGVSSMDSETFSSRDGSILAVLAELSARDRRSAIPETIIAQRTGVAHDDIHERCNDLVEHEKLARNRWEKEGEVLDEYYITDEGAFQFGREYDPDSSEIPE